MCLVVPGGSNDERLTDVDTRNCYICKQFNQYLASCEVLLRTFTYEVDDLCRKLAAESLFGCAKSKDSGRLMRAPNVLFMRRKYAKVLPEHHIVASVATVKSCVTIGPIS